MFSKTVWLWRRIASQLWLRVASFSVIAVAIALIAAFLTFPVPDALAERISGKVVESMLTLLAGSMLGVVTFSLGAMVTAYASTSGSGTPRATSLLREDGATQTALSIFLGAFIYAMAGLIALSFGAYGSSGRVILFFVTIGVIVVIVAALIRWIHVLTRIGRLSTTIDYVVDAARDSLVARRDAPCLGGHRWTREAPGAGARPICAPAIGYVQLIDVESLSARAEDEKAEVYVNALPGDYVHPGRPIAFVVGGEDGHEQDWASDFVIAEERTYAQDPRFGLIVLTEIAQRALSPAVNDPGTAISVLMRAVPLIGLWRDRQPEQTPQVSFPRLHVPQVSMDDVFEDVFRPIARDGAGLVEVQLRLQAALAALHALGGPEMKAAAIRQSREALARCDALPIDADREAVARAARWSAPD